MKHLFSLFLAFGLLVSVASAQTLTIGPTSVEVITSGAKTRAFYRLDEVTLDYKVPTLTVREAASGSILVALDTSLVTITGVTLWSAKMTKLRAWMQELTTTTGYTWFLPKRGVNYLYRTSDNSATAIFTATKYSLLKTHLDSVKVTGVTGVSPKLAWLRGKAFLFASRDNLDHGEAATVAAGAAAGTSPTIAIAGGAFSGKITLTTGSSPTTTGVICTVTLPVTYPNNVIATLTPADADAAGHVARVFVSSAAGNTFTLNASGTALSGATEYIFNYSTAGYGN